MLFFAELCHLKGWKLEWTTGRKFVGSWSEVRVSISWSGDELEKSFESECFLISCWLTAVHTLRNMSHLGRYLSWSVVMMGFVFANDDEMEQVRTGRVDSLTHESIQRMYPGDSEELTVLSAQISSRHTSVGSPSSRRPICLDECFTRRRLFIGSLFQNLRPLEKLV